MTSVSESRIGSVLSDLVHPLPEENSLGGALRVAGEGAVALTQGSTAAGILVARKGIEVTRELAARARRAREDAAPLLKVPARAVAPLAEKLPDAVKPAAAAKPKRSLRPGRKTLVAAGVVGAVALAGAVFYRSTKPTHPPVAPEPPRVRPIDPVAEDVTP